MDLTLCAYIIKVYAIIAATVFCPETKKSLAYTDPQQVIVASSVFWNISFMNKPANKRDEFLNLLQSAESLARLPYEPNYKQKMTIAQESFDKTVAGNHAVEWTVDGVFKKLEEYKFRCAITGIPRSHSKLTMDRITDADSTYCEEHTTPMLPELNMGKGTMDHIFRDQESIRLEFGDGQEVDYHSQREEMISRLQEIVQDLLGNGLAMVEDTIRLNLQA